LPQILNQQQKLVQIKEMHHRVDLNEIKQHQLRHQEQLMLIEFKKVNSKRHQSLNHKPYPSRAHSVQAAFPDEVEDRSNQMTP